MWEFLRLSLELGRILQSVFYIIQDYLFSAGLADRVFYRSDLGFFLRMIV